MKARYLCGRTSWKPPLLFLSLPTGFQTEFPPIGPIFFAPHPERDVAIAVRQGDGPTTGERERERERKARFFTLPGAAQQEERALGCNSIHFSSQNLSQKLSQVIFGVFIHV